MPHTRLVNAMDIVQTAMNLSPGAIAVICSIDFFFELERLCGIENHDRHLCEIFGLPISINPRIIGFAVAINFDDSPSADNPPVPPTDKKPDGAPKDAVH